MKSKKDYQITAWVQSQVQAHVPPGGLYMDATMGRGSDTLFLCRLAGEAGHVTAFDIQQEALDYTENRLEQELAFQNYELIRDSHANMGRYASPGTVDCIMFNLGYLPGGDHTLATRADSTLCALGKGLELLKPGGLLSICIYSGGDSGFEERDSVLEWLRSLDSRRYLVLVTSYFNRPNNPPIPALVIKLL